MWRFMHPALPAQASLSYKRFCGSLWSDFFFLLAPFSLPFFVHVSLLATLVSSRTGYTKLINFERTTPPPNGAAALCSRVHNAVMTPRSKGHVASSSIKGKNCTCTMCRLSEGSQPASSDQNISRHDLTINNFIYIYIYTYIYVHTDR